MNIKRYFAPDMRRAIHLVRTEHGPDAVILSSDSVDGGVEIIAAVDYDENLVTRMLGRSERGRADSALVEAAEPSEPPRAAAPPAVAAAEAPTPPRAPAAELAPASAPTPAPASAPTPAPAPAPAPNVVDVETTRELRAIQKDLNALRGLVRERFAWSDLRAMTPQRSWLMRRAEALGLTASLTDTIVSEVAHPEDEDRAWRELLFALARRLIVMREDPIETGGVFALVGPTGVGKTTTIAKLAARHCLQHGRESLALITTDNFRIGAHRQLDAYAAILGVPVRTADSPESLARLLEQLKQRRLVLIDTAGVAPRDSAIASSLTNLSVHTEIKRFLVLAAHMQATVMHKAVRAFGGPSLAGVALTKIDETDSLGAAISVLIESRLPAVWLSDGQRVPEDLKLARVAHLLKGATVPHETDESQAVPAFMPTAAGRGGEVHARL